MQKPATVRAVAGFFMPQGYVIGKQLLNFANLTRKEHFNFPATNSYHSERTNLSTGKLSHD